MLLHSLAFCAVCYKVVVLNLRLLLLLLLLCACQICGEGQTAGQKAILDCTAELATKEADVMAKLGHCIKALYDADLAEEETINAWFAGLENGSPAKKNAAGFVKWLATVDEDSDSDNSDDSDDDSDDD